MWKVFIKLPALQVRLDSCRDEVMSQFPNGFLLTLYIPAGEQSRQFSLPASVTKTSIPNLSPDVDYVVTIVAFAGSRESLPISGQITRESHRRKTENRPTKSFCSFSLLSPNKPLISTNTRKTPDKSVDTCGPDLFQFQLNAFCSLDLIQFLVSRHSWFQEKVCQNVFQKLKSCSENSDFTYCFHDMNNLGILFKT